MNSRIIWLGLVGLLLGREHTTQAEQSAANHVQQVKLLYEEMAAAGSTAEYNDLRVQLNELLREEEGRQPQGRLDQGGEGWWDATELPPDPSISASGTTVGYQNDFNVADLEWPPNPCWEGYFSQTLSCAGPDVAYRYTVPLDGQYRVSLCNGPLYDSGLLVYVYTGNQPSNFTDLICGNDDFCGLTSELTTPFLPAGEELLLVVDGWNASAGDYTVQIELVQLNIPPNDLCADPLFLEPWTAVTGFTTDATLDDVPDCGTSISAPGVWYVTVGTGNTMTAHTCFGADYDTKINIFSGDCSLPVCVSGNDDACGLNSSISWCSVAGEQYLILVQGFGGQTGSFTLMLEDDGVPCSSNVYGVKEVYDAGPSIYGQPIVLRAVTTDDFQRILLDHTSLFGLNEDFGPYMSLQVPPLEWSIYIPPHLWDGELIEVPGFVQPNPTGFPGYDLEFVPNAPGVVAPTRPSSIPDYQTNWRPPGGWVADTTNCDSCLFAVLISGGIDDRNNRVDYWRDLEDFYCYKATHGYCPRNIKVHYYKGTGVNNTIPAANVDSCTEAKVAATMAAVAAKVKACKTANKKPKVEVMTTNHGKKGPNGGINTTGRDSTGSSNVISPSTFTNWIQALIDSGAAEIEVEMGQCYSGQMIDHLRGNLDSKGAKVTAASAAPDSLPSWSRGGNNGWNRWLNPLVCARHEGHSLPEAIRRANQSYDSSLARNDTNFTRMAAYYDSLRTAADSVKAQKERAAALKARNGKGGETVWYTFSLPKRCQGDTIAVTPGGRLEITFSGPAKSCGNCEIKCKNSAGQWVSYRNWNWNVPGSAGYANGNNVRTLDAGAGHTGLYVIHSRSDSFKVSVKAINPPLPPNLETDPSNPETFAGFSVGWTSGNSDEFGFINAGVHVIPDVDDDGFNMSSSPKYLGSGGVDLLVAQFDVLAENYWWTDMNLYVNVLNGIAGTSLTFDCPDCEHAAGGHTLSGGNEEFVLNLGSINQLGQHEISLSASGLMELDCWGLESARSTGIPPAVSDLTILRIGDDIHLFWSAVPVAVSYIVQRSADFGGPWSDVATVNAPGFVHLNQANAPETQVYYQVIAVGP